MLYRQYFSCLIAVCRVILGPDPDRVLQDNMVSMCAVLEEQKHKKQAAPVPISGPELAAMMKIGTRVMRGVDWKWGDQVTSNRSKIKCYFNVMDRGCVCVLVFKSHL